MIKHGWIPPVSPYGLIQESLFPDEWLTLVVCMMLNCTSRKQVEKILPEFRSRWPGPKEFSQANLEEVVSLCRPLGFANKRSIALKKMTDAYLNSRWKHVSELPGIGVYGSRAWEMFCRGIIGDTRPDDGALGRYYDWVKRGNNGNKGRT